MPPLLEVRRLSLETVAHGQKRRLLRDVSFEIETGEIVALVGESGSGKTLTALAIARLLPNNVRQHAGEIRLGGERIDALAEEAMCRIRGKRIGMIFQEPMTSLNPVLTVGFQVEEGMRIHGFPASEVRRRAKEYLAAVRFRDPERIFRSYPHELSGGERQRAMIAAVLAPSPELVIADEPTTALDVTIQKEILEVLRELQSRGTPEDSSGKTSFLFISHDLAVVSEIADRILVLYRGSLVEVGPPEKVLSAPAHPYTKALLDAIPRERLRLPEPPPGDEGEGEENEPEGKCIYFSRCPLADAVCRKEPGLSGLEGRQEHRVKCVKPLLGTGKE